MSHPSKRQKLGSSRATPPPPSTSALKRIRQQHNALQVSLRSNPNYGRRAKDILSQSPEPAEAPAHAETPAQMSDPAPAKDDTPKPTTAEYVTNGGIGEVEAIQLRKKNEKARRKQEKRDRKRRKQEEKERSTKESEDAEGYASWNGISDGPDQPSPRPRKMRKTLVEEAVVLEAKGHLKHQLTEPEAQPTPTPPEIVKADATSQKKKKKRKRQAAIGSCATTLPEQPSPTPKQKGDEDGNNILPSSLVASPVVANQAPPPGKISSVWDRMRSNSTASKGTASIGSSRNSMDSLSETIAPTSDTSNITIHSEEQPSPISKDEKSSAADSAVRASGLPRVYKNLPLKTKSKASHDVGNDSTIGLVDPLTPVPSKAQAKSKTQVSLELQAVRRTLPIWSFQEEIRSIISDSNTMVLVGETGSGKSTQIGQFLLKEPWMARGTGSSGKKYGGCIAITQPRRVAAISLAQRVSSEMGTPLGRQVGYCVRFDNQSDDSTKIRYLTDGMLLNEILHDPELSRYSAVVVDEAHERSISTDLGLGLLKGIVQARQEKKAPLKLIVMSATLDVEKMAAYIGVSPAAKPATNEEPLVATDKEPLAPICRIPGKMYPIETFYTPMPIEDFQTAAIKSIFQVHYQYPCPGDILVFSTGSEEIEELATAVEELSLQMEADKPKIQVMRLYASLDPAEQQKVFIKGDPRVRRVIIATNIAETSVTVPGVRHVIDCGKVKTKRFRHQLGIESLLVTEISRASAQQRKGRAGREGPGTCYRLYTESSHGQFAKDTEPEIMHCDLSGALLTLSARGVDQVYNFPFLDKPDRHSFEKALLVLNMLDALDDDGKITEIGKKMSKFPLPPVQSRVIVAASEEENGNENKQENVLVDVIDVLSCLSVEGNILLQPTRWNKASEGAKKPVDPLLPLKKKRKKAAEEDSDDELTVEEKVHSKRMEIVHPSGDHLTYLNILRRYLSKRSNEQKRFCQEYQVSYPLMRKVENIRRQLRGYCRLDKVGELPRDSEMKYESETMVARYPRVSQDQADKILKCFLKGVGVESVARKVAGGKYRTLTASGNSASGVDVSVHPSSCLMWERHVGNDSKRAKKEEGESDRRDEGFGEAVMYQDVVWTSKAFMKCVSKIKLEWLEDLWVFV
ncbi:hypothetical protein DRE_03993 [Drechslerella stenobrocha 248]|uniref:RNA helicase n=1 Tax=Drechslerella stenobrocha 248 TaxID=1043628 RepID=W7I3I1_9PEZI|nr:hypothetical protein DRE_03993 [Drechslerella stenobrocha 248]